MSLLIPSYGIVAEENLTLEQALETALKHNPEIQLAEKDLKASHGRRLQMEAIPDPQIVFSEEGLALGQKLKNQEEREITFGIQQNFEFPAIWSLRGKVGKYDEDISSLEFEKTKLIIQAKVKRAYFKTVFTEKTIATLEKTLSLLDQLIRNIQIQYQAGTSSYRDILRAKVEKLRIQNQLIEEKKEWKINKADLNLLLGREGNAPLNLITDISFTPFQKDLAQVQAEAKRKSPSLRIASSKFEQNRLSLKLAKMNYLPDFSLGIFFPSLRTDAWGFGLGVSIPLYWWKNQKGQTLEAEALRDKSLISARAEEKRIMARIESAYAQVKAVEEQVNIFEKTLLKEVEDELQISLNYYQYGKLEAYSLIDFYRTYASTKLEHLKSVYLYQMALVDLELAGEE